MDAWVLLLVSGGMAWISAETARWFWSLRALKQKDLEKLVGLDKQMDDASITSRPFLVAKSLTFVFFLLVGCAAITVALVIATVKAFSGAL